MKFIPFNIHPGTYFFLTKFGMKGGNTHSGFEA